MASVQDQLEIKFRLIDGSDIGPKTFPAATSVATLKESVIAQWPKEKENGPRTVKDVNNDDARCCSTSSFGERKENNKRTKAEQMCLCHIIISSSNRGWHYFQMNEWCSWYRKTSCGLFDR
ncbi:hypothetical protein V6N11_044402 [Hibiscus sabdariffa]|uniref:UBL3-like ubiquitin domain-containing protein n=1 Tax=Hibiscus sabdariffa TaxID=183260 RepID=A0ABR2RFB9_9ROSI